MRAHTHKNSYIYLCMYNLITHTHKSKAKSQLIGISPIWSSFHFTVFLILIGGDICWYLVSCPRMLKVLSLQIVAAAATDAAAAKRDGDVFTLYFARRARAKNWHQLWPNGQNWPEGKWATSFVYVCVFPMCLMVANRQHYSVDRRVGIRSNAE